MSRQSCVSSINLAFDRPPEDRLTKPHSQLDGHVSFHRCKYQNDLLQKPDPKGDDGEKKNLRFPISERAFDEGCLYRFSSFGEHANAHSCWNPLIICLFNFSPIILRRIA